MKQILSVFVLVAAQEGGHLQIHLLTTIKFQILQI
jgi:hypothetical protein